jgi:hypothetical protein
MQTAGRGAAAWQPRKGVHEQVVQLLLQHGADVHAAGRLRRLLIWAAQETA